MRWEVIRDPIKAKFKPGDACLAECRTAGRLLADKAAALAATAGYEPLVTD